MTGSRAATIQRLTLAPAAVALLAWTPFTTPVETLPAAPSCCLGIAIGTTVFALLARKLRPPSPAHPGLVRALALVAPNLLVGAVAEEAIWRYAVIGALRPSTGTLGAAAASSAAFALAHLRSGLRAVRVHLATGFAFALAYLATGHLAAAVSAHLTYNLLVVALRVSARDGPIVQST